MIKRANKNNGSSTLTVHADKRKGLTPLFCILNSHIKFRVQMHIKQYFQVQDILDNLVEACNKRVTVTSLSPSVECRDTYRSESL